jgi:RNA polymerase sigma-70 factor (ECF subfamily)
MHPDEIRKRDASTDQRVTLRAPNSSTQPSSFLPSVQVEVFQEHRRLLFSIAYRMLGTRVDAEDMLQETFLRWQRVSESEIRDPRAFLVTVITRLCINQLQSARVMREQYFGLWLPEPLVSRTTDESLALSDLNESLSMAFLLLLERLTPTERAVFLLREVFEYEYAELSEMLGQSEANCRQILKRARHHISQVRTRFDTSPQKRQKLLNEFLTASFEGNMEGLLSVLASDVVLYTDGGGKASAVPNPIYGAEKVARFFIGAREKLLPSNLIWNFAQINGQLGVVAYHEDRVFGVLTMDTSEVRILNIYIVRNPEKLKLLEQLPRTPFP